MLSARRPNRAGKWLERERASQEGAHTMTLDMSLGKREGEVYISNVYGGAPSLGRCFRAVSVCLSYPPQRPRR